MPHWARLLGIDRAVLLNSARAAVAAVASMLLARVLDLPEFYWAPISTIVILLSTIDPLTLAWQRFAGTAVGAIVGALTASFFHPNWLVYGVGIFVCGIFCALLRLGTAYRFAAITLSIVLLIAHGRSPWIVATHRFVEVSLGIAVALLVTLVWPMPISTPCPVYPLKSDRVSEDPKPKP
ncbi:MAG TPA: FUSC family protein [Candidatus Sulfotelmatobacter sp.]